MRKVFWFFWLLLIVGLLTIKTTTVLAQDNNNSPYEKAHSEYLSQMTVYQRAHQDYTLRKAQYESFKTLQSQQDAQAATVKLLQERDEAVIKYLQAVKERVLENPGIDETRKEFLVERIDLEISWFSDHKANIPTAGSLKDLTNDSNDARGEYEAAHPVFYEAIANVSNGTFTDMFKRLGDKFTELKEVVENIKSEDREEYTFSSQKLLRLDRWIFDAESTRTRALQKQGEAEALIITFSGKNKSPKNLPDAYTNVLGSLSEAQQYLRESGRYMQEIIKDIKTDED